MRSFQKNYLLKNFNVPETDGSGFIRKELQKATELLKQSGWILKVN